MKGTKGDGEQREKKDDQGEHGRRPRRGQSRRTRAGRRDSKEDDVPTAHRSDTSEEPEKRTGSKGALGRAKAVRHSNFFWPGAVVRY